jgi:hypothetical protein
MKKENWVKISEKYFEYALYSDESGKFYLEVVGGGILMSIFYVELTQVEMNEFQLEGEIFLEALSRDILKRTSKYEPRLLKVE